MIDDVRTTVLAVLNKNNYGYLSPMDFNLYAKQAQLEIFENLFYQYNNQINSENARRSGTDYANISKGILEDIDLFSKDSILNSSYGTFVLPSDYYFINTITVSVNNVNIEVERVSQGKITALKMSPLTAPTNEFPVYTQEGGIIDITPNPPQATARYIRYPFEPKWTYTAVGNNVPIFNPSAGDYRDFDLPLGYQNELVNKILKYAGVEIRETMVVDFANKQEQQNNIEQQ
jgi:hypothetical protein